MKILYASYKYFWFYFNIENLLKRVFWQIIILQNFIKLDEEIGIGPIYQYTGAFFHITIKLIMQRKVGATLLAYSLYILICVLTLFSHQTFTFYNFFVYQCNRIAKFFSVCAFVLIYSSSLSGFQGENIYYSNTLIFFTLLFGVYFVFIFQFIFSKYEAIYAPLVEYNGNFAVEY